MKHFIKNTDEFIINVKSVCLAKEVTRTLAVVTSCCTNSVEFVKVMLRVPGYGCWLHVTLIASLCCSDGDVPASGLGALGIRKTIMRLRLISHLFKNSHRIPTEPMGIRHISHTHTHGNSHTHGSPGCLSEIC